MDMTLEERLRLFQLMPYQRDPTRIASGRDHWGAMTGLPAASVQRDDYYALVIAQRFPAEAGAAIIGALSLPPAGPPIYAEVRQNRWCAICECACQDGVEASDPFYFCFICGNLISDGHPRPVIFPPDFHRVEAMLLLRPDPFTRNFKARESLDMLAAQNIEHGLPVL